MNADWKYILRALLFVAWMSSIVLDVHAGCKTCNLDECGTVTVCDAPTDTHPNILDDLCQGAECRDKEEGMLLNATAEEVTHIDITDVNLLQDQDKFTTYGVNIIWHFKAPRDTFTKSNIKQIFLHNTTNLDSYEGGIPIPSSLNWIYYNPHTDTVDSYFPFVGDVSLKNIRFYNSTFEYFPKKVFDLVDVEITEIVLFYNSPIVHELELDAFTKLQGLVDSRNYIHEGTEFLYPTNCSSGDVRNVTSRDQTISVCVLPNPEVPAEIAISLLALILIMVGIIILIVSVIVIFICYKRKKAKKQASDKLSDHYVTYPVEHKTNREFIPCDDVQILRRVGRGACGEVMLARFAGSYVVLKKDMSWNTETEYESFKKEIDLFKTLKHPNILQYIGITQIPSPFVSMETCIVCEYMPQGDLRMVLSMHDSLLHKLESEDGRNSPFTDSISSDTSIRSAEIKNRLLNEFNWENLKLSIAIDILSGLMYLHHMNPTIIHRDLKSLNVLLNDSFHAKIGDFGTSREVTGTSTMTVMGSNLWIAPEIVTGENFDEKADMFSFGIVLSELITHELPYSDVIGKNGKPLQSMAISYQVAYKQLRPTIETNPPPPSFIKELFERCTAEKPEDRPTAKEALDFLSAYQTEVWSTDLEDLV